MRGTVWPKRWPLLVLFAPFVPALAQTQNGMAQELLRQQERERVLREQQESLPDVRLPPVQIPAPEQLPDKESPCFPISQIELEGDQSQRFIGGRYSVRGFDGELMLMGERGWAWHNEIGVSVGAYYGHVGGPSTRWLQERNLAGSVIGLGAGAWHHLA
ncbi:ShlB/FhaC/HecB family hemolysin secretion/activation protein [Alcaligenes ammonioxydans]|jgi:hemolysin activation/secretion protein|uniref:Haemolysin activator HlyB C-terminal domain-containing protein n=2 Tax=Alcaligenes TaxID=507 RepID=A0ABX8SS13_9BURK|nr:hypothetical protein FE795_07175 [Alcaligenes ammonioxydans]